ncbi:MAG TPA: MATE family efflux transporter [Candidatus Binatia bacterium]|nr:MATE family efflux transporter [Candidatus Binatia bacterium]
MNRGSAARAVSVDEPVAPASVVTYRRIWELAWPVSISTSTVTLLTLVNLYWVGHLGTVAVAAVSLCGNSLFIVFGISNIVYTGALAIVARRVGEGNLVHAFEATLHAVCLAALLGVAVAVIGYTVAPAIVGFFGAGAAVDAVAVPFLRISFIGQIFLFISVALSASYQAAGDTRTPMLINIAVVLVNGLLDPFFIFEPGQVAIWGVSLGWLGWGVNGGAVAAALAGAGGGLLFIALSLRRDQPFPRPRHQRLALSLDDFARMMRVGTPASLSMIARPLSTFLLLKVIASFGTAAIAAFGIALRSFSVNWIPYSGINTAVSSLVGQNLGARNLTAATRAVAHGLVVSSLLGIGFCVLYYSFAQEIMLAFDHEPAVLAAGAPFLKLMALSFLFSAPMLPLVSAMNGAGDTKPPMITAFLANWPLKLPLSYVLALPLGYGVNGVWIGMLVSIVFETMVVAAWYRRGSWKTKKL